MICSKVLLLAYSTNNHDLDIDVFLKNFSDVYNRQLQTKQARRVMDVREGEYLIPSQISSEQYADTSKLKVLKSQQTS